MFPIPTWYNTPPPNLADLKNYFYQQKKKKKNTINLDAESVTTA